MKTEIPDIAIWTHRPSPLVARCAESVARHTRGSFQLIVICEPGNCHENMNKVLLRSRSRYTVFLDEDVEILDDDWLGRLLEDLRAHDDLAVVGSREVKDPYARAIYRRRPELLLGVGGGAIEFVSWIPAYCMCFDRRRLATLTFDEQIPGEKGMTDVDACLQVRRRGLRVAVDNRFAVYHPYKGASERAKSAPRELAWFEAQRRYMIAKWGDLYAGDPTMCPGGGDPALQSPARDEEAARPPIIGIGSKV